MNTKDIPALVASLFTFNQFDNVEFSQILSLLKYCDDAYFNGDEGSPLSDAQYDALRRYAHTASPTDEYFIGIGSSQRGGKVKLPFQLGSLNQVEIGELAAWTSKHPTLRNVVISDKLDGASVLLIYNQSGKLQIAYSRGNGIEGADITRHMVNIPTLPLDVGPLSAPLAVRAENIIPKHLFNDARSVVMSRSGRPYANPRNMVSGIMNASSNDDRVYRYIHTVAYEIVNITGCGKADQLAQLQTMGFNVVPHSVGSLPTEGELASDLTKRRQSSMYELDGLVIDIDDAGYRGDLYDPSVLNQPYAFKYKVADVTNQSDAEVVQVNWAISKDGYLKPTIQIKPVTLVGVTIQNCTGFNAKFIKDNCIGPQAVISITRSGDVIPFCQRVVVPSPTGPQLPIDVSTKWSETGVDLILQDLNNEEVRYQQMVDFFGTVDVPFLADGNIRQLFDCGFCTIEQVVTIDAEDLCALFGLTQGRKISNSITSKFSNIPEYVLMGAHPCFGRGVGVRKMKKLYDAFRGDMVQCMDTNKIIQVEGFDHKTAVKIAGGWPEFVKFKECISSACVITPYIPPIEGSLTGKSVVMTGFRDKTVELMITENGGKVGTSVSTKTAIVIAANATESSTKLDKARELGIQIMSKQEFMDEYRTKQSH